MNEDELRQACKVTRQRMNRCVNIDDTINVLLAFARRMMAVGVRSVKERLEQSQGGGVETGYGAGWSRACQVNANWCEAEAKRLEGL